MVAQKCAMTFRGNCICIGHPVFDRPREGLRRSFMSMAGIGRLLTSRVMLQHEIFQTLDTWCKSEWSTSRHGQASSAPLAGPRHYPQDAWQMHGVAYGAILLLYAVLRNVEWHAKV